MNQRYATPESQPEKTREWLKALAPYARNRSRFCPRAENTALLVVDAQDYFLAPSSLSYLPAANAVLPNIKALLKEFRKEKLPIFFTRHVDAEDDMDGPMEPWWGKMLLESDPLSEISGKLAPKKGEKIINKSQYSAFWETELDEILQDLNIEDIIIAGVMTHLCVDTTARDAFMLNYRVFIPVDATATKTEELHLGSLMALSNGFAVPVSTKEIIDSFKGEK